MLDKRVVGKKHKRIQYLMSWVGYGPEDESWIPVGYLKNAQDKLAIFESENAVVLFYFILSGFIFLRINYLQTLLYNGEYCCK